METVTRRPSTVLQQRRRQPLTSERIKDLIVQEAVRIGINPYLLPAIFAIARLESDYNPEKVGDGDQSYGLFQFHIGYKRDDLRTLKAQGLLPDIPVEDEERLKEWLKDPRNNIRAFLYLIRPLQERLKNLGLLPRNEQEMQKFAQNPDIVTPFTALAIFWNRPAKLDEYIDASGRGDVEGVRKVIRSLGYVSPKGVFEPQRLEYVRKVLQTEGTSGLERIKQYYTSRWQGQMEANIRLIAPSLLPKFTGGLVKVTGETAQAAVGPIAFGTIMQGYPFFAGLSDLIGAVRRTQQLPVPLKIGLWQYVYDDKTKKWKWKREEISLKDLQADLDNPQKQQEAQRKIVQHILALSSPEGRQFAELLATKWKGRADPIYGAIYDALSSLRASLQRLQKQKQQKGERAQEVFSIAATKPGTPEYNEFVRSAYRLREMLGHTLTQPTGAPIVGRLRGWLKGGWEFVYNLTAIPLFALVYVGEQFYDPKGTGGVGEGIDEYDLDNAFYTVLDRWKINDNSPIAEILKREFAIYKQWFLSRLGVYVRTGSQLFAAIPGLFADFLRWLRGYVPGSGKNVIGALLHKFEQSGIAGHMRKNAVELARIISQNKQLRNQHFLNAINMLLAFAPSEIIEKPDGTVDITEEGWVLYARNLLTSFVDETLQEALQRVPVLGARYRQYRDIMLSEASAFTTLAATFAVGPFARGAGRLLERLAGGAERFARTLSASAAALKGGAAPTTIRLTQAAQEAAAVAKGVADASESASFIRRIMVGAPSAWRQAKIAAFALGSSAAEKVAAGSRLLRPFVERNIPELVLGGPVAAITGPILRYAGSKVAAQALDATRITKAIGFAKAALGVQDITEEVAQRVISSVARTQRFASFLSDTLPHLITNITWTAAMTQGPEIDPAERQGMFIAGLLLGHGLQGSQAILRFLRGKIRGGVEGHWYAPLAPIESERAQETFIRLVPFLRNIPIPKQMELLRQVYTLEELSLAQRLLDDINQTAQNLLNEYINFLPPAELNRVLKALEQRVPTLQPLQRPQLKPVVGAILQDAEALVRSQPEVANRFQGFLLTPDPTSPTPTRQPAYERIQEVVAEDISKRNVSPREQNETLANLAAYHLAFLKAIGLRDVLESVAAEIQKRRDKPVQEDALRNLLSESRAQIENSHATFLRNIENAQDVEGIFAAYETFLTEVSHNIGRLLDGIRSLIYDEPTAGEVFALRWREIAEEKGLAQKVTEKYVVPEQDIQRLTGKTLDEIRTIFAQENHEGRIEFWAKNLMQGISDEELQHVKQAISSTNRGDFEITGETALMLADHIPPLSFLTRHHLDELARGTKQFYVVLGDIPSAYYAATNMAIEAKKAGILDNIGFHILRNDARDEALLFAYNRAQMQDLRNTMERNLANIDVQQFIRNLSTAVDNLNVDNVTKNALREFIGQINQNALANAVNTAFSAIQQSTSLEDFIGNVFIPLLTRPIGDITIDKILPLFGAYGFPIHARLLIRLMEQHWMEKLANYLYTTKHLNQPNTYPDPEATMPAITQYMRSQLEGLLKDLGWSQYLKLFKASSLKDVPEISEITLHLERLIGKSRQLLGEVNTNQKTIQDAQNEWRKFLNQNPIIRRGREKINAVALLNEITSREHNFETLDAETPKRIQNVINQMEDYKKRLDDLWMEVFQGSTTPRNVIEYLPSVMKLYVYSNILRDPYFVDVVRAPRTFFSPLSTAERTVRTIPEKLLSEMSERTGMARRQAIIAEMFIKLRDYLRMEQEIATRKPEAINSYFKAMFGAPILVVPHTSSIGVVEEAVRAFFEPYILLIPKQYAFEFRFADIRIDENAPGIQVDTLAKWSSQDRFFVQLSVTMRPQDWQALVDAYRQEIGNFLDQINTYLVRAPAYWATGYSPGHAANYQRLLNALRERIPAIWFVTRLAKETGDPKLQALAQLTKYFYRPLREGIGPHEILFGPELISEYLSDIRVMMFPFVSQWRDLLSAEQIEEFMRRIDSSSLPPEAKKILHQYLDMPFSIVPFYKRVHQGSAGNYYADIIPTPGNILIHEGILYAISNGLHEAMHAIASQYPYREEGGHTRSTLFHELLRKHGAVTVSDRRFVMSKIAPLVSEFGQNYANVAYKPWFFIQDVNEARQIGETIGNFLVFASLTPAAKLVHMGGYAKELLNETAKWLICSLYGALEKAGDVNGLDDIGKAFVEGIHEGFGIIRFPQTDLIVEEYAKRLAEGMDVLREFFIEGKGGQPSVLANLQKFANDLRELGMKELPISWRWADAVIGWVDALVAALNEWLTVNNKTINDLKQSWDNTAKQLTDRLQDHVGGNRIGANELPQLKGLFDGALMVNGVRNLLRSNIRSILINLEKLHRSLIDEVVHGNISREKAAALMERIKNLHDDVYQLVRTFYDIDGVLPTTLDAALAEGSFALIKGDGTFNLEILRKFAKLLDDKATEDFLTQIINFQDAAAREVMYNILSANKYTLLVPQHSGLRDLVRSKESMWDKVLSEPHTALTSLVTMDLFGTSSDIDLQALTYLGTKVIADYFLPLNNYTFKKLFETLYAQRGNPAVVGDPQLSRIANDSDLLTLLQKRTDEDTIQTLLQGITSTPQAFGEFIGTMKWLQGELVSGFTKRVHESISVSPKLLAPTGSAFRHLEVDVPWGAITSGTPYFARSSPPIIIGEGEGFIHVGPVPVPVSPEVRQAIQQANTTLAAFFKPLAKDITEVFSYAAGADALLTTLSSPRYGLKPDVYPVWFEVADNAIQFFARTARELDNLIQVAHKKLASGEPINPYLEEALAVGYPFSYAKRAEILSRLTGDALGAVSDEALRRRLVWELMRIAGDELCGWLARHFTLYVRKRILEKKALVSGVQMEDIVPWIRQNVRNIVLSAFTDGIYSTYNRPRDTIYVLEDFQKFFTEFRRFAKDYKFSSILASQPVVFENFKFSAPPEFSNSPIAQFSSRLIQSLESVPRTFVLPRASGEHASKASLAERHRWFTDKYVSRTAIEIPVEVLNRREFLSGISDLIADGIQNLEKYGGNYNVFHRVLDTAMQVLLDRKSGRGELLPFFAALYQIDPDYVKSQYSAYFTGDRFLVGMFVSDLASKKHLRDQFASDIGVLLTYFTQAAVKEYIENFAGIDAIRKVITANSSLLREEYQKKKEELKAQPLSIAFSAFLHTPITSQFAKQMERAVGRQVSSSLVETFAHTFLSKVSSHLPDAVQRVGKIYPEILQLAGGADVILSAIEERLAADINSWISEVRKGEIIDIKEALRFAIKAAVDKVLPMEEIQGQGKVRKASFADKLADDLLAAASTDLQRAGKEIHDTFTKSLNIALDSRKAANIREWYLYLQHPEVFSEFPRGILAEITDNFDTSQVLAQLGRIWMFYTEPGSDLRNEAISLIRQFMQERISEEGLVDGFVNLVGRLHLDAKGFDYIQEVIGDHVNKYIDHLVGDIVNQTATPVTALISGQIIQDNVHHVDVHLKSDIARRILSRRLWQDRRGFANAKLLVSLAALAGLAAIPSVAQHFPGLKAFLHNTVELFFSSPITPYLTGAFVGSSVLYSLLRFFRRRWELAAPLAELPVIAGELIRASTRASEDAKKALEATAKQIEQRDPNFAALFRSVADAYIEEDNKPFQISGSFYRALERQIEKGEIEPYSLLGYPRVSKDAVTEMTHELLDGVFEQAASSITGTLEALQKSLSKTVRKVKTTEFLRLLASWAQSQDPAHQQLYQEASKAIANASFDWELLKFIEAMISKRGVSSLSSERKTPLRDIAISGKKTNLKPQPYWAKVRGEGISHTIDWDTQITIGNITKKVGDITLEEAVTSFLQRRLPIALSYDGFIETLQKSNKPIETLKDWVIKTHRKNIVMHIDDVMEKYLGEQWSEGTKNFDNAWKSIQLIYSTLSDPVALHQLQNSPQTRTAFMIRLLYAKNALENVAKLPLSQELKTIADKSMELLNSVEDVFRKKYPTTFEAAESIVKQLAAESEKLLAILTSDRPIAQIQKAFLGFKNAVRKALAAFILTRPARMEMAYGREYGPELSNLFAQIDNAIASAWTRERAKPLDLGIWEAVIERHRNNPLYSTVEGKYVRDILSELAKRKGYSPITMWMGLARTLWQQVRSLHKHAKRAGISFDDLWSAVQRIFAEVHQNEMLSRPYENFERIIDDALKGYDPKVSDFLKKNLSPSMKGKLIALSLLTHYLIDYLATKSGIADILTAGVPEFGLVEKAYLPQRMEVQSLAQMLGGLLLSDQVIRRVAPTLLEYKSFKERRTGRGADNRDIAIELYGHVIRQLITETALQPFREQIDLLKRLLPEELSFFLDKEIAAVMYPKGLSILNAYDLLLTELAGVAEPWQRFFTMFSGAKELNAAAAVGQYLSRVLGTLQASTLVFSLPSVIRQFTGLSTTMAILSSEYGPGAHYTILYYLPQALMTKMREEGTLAPHQKLAIDLNEALKARMYSTMRHVAMTASDVLREFVSSKEGQILLEEVFNPNAPKEASVAVLRRINEYIEGHGNLAQKVLKLGMALLEWTDEAMVLSSYLAAFSLKYNELARGRTLTESEHLEIIQRAIDYASSIAESTQASPSWSYAPLAFTGARMFAPGALGALFNTLLGAPFLRQFVLFTFAHSNAFLRTLGYTWQGLRNIRTPEGFEMFLKGILGVTSFILFVNLLNAMYGAVTGRQLEEVPYTTPTSSDDTSLPNILWETLKTATPIPVQRILAILLNVMTQKVDPTSQLVATQLPPVLQTAREAYYFVTTGVPSIYEAIMKTAALPNSRNLLDRIQLVLHTLAGMGSAESAVGRIAEGIASLVILASGLNPKWAELISAIPTGTARRSVRYLGSRIAEAPVSPVGATLTTPVGEAVTGILFGQPMRESVPTLAAPIGMVGAAPVTKVRSMKGSAEEKAQALQSEVGNIAPLETAMALYEYTRRANSPVDIKTVALLTQPRSWPENTRVGRIWREWLKACARSIEEGSNYSWLDYIYRNTGEFLLLNYIFGPDVVFAPIRQAVPFLAAAKTISAALKDSERMALLIAANYTHATPRIAKFIADRLAILADNNLPNYWRIKAIELRRRRLVQERSRKAKVIKALGNLQGRILKAQPIKETETGR